MKQLKETLITLEILNLALSKGFSIKHLVTQSLLQKWIRETLLINVSVNYFPNIEKYICTFVPIFKPKDNQALYFEFLSNCYTERFDTYEEALEQGLLQSLIFDYNQFDYLKSKDLFNN